MQSIQHHGQWVAVVLMELMLKAEQALQLMAAGILDVTEMDLVKLMMVMPQVFDERQEVADVYQASSRRTGFYECVASPWLNL